MKYSTITQSVAIKRFAPSTIYFLWWKHNSYEREKFFDGFNQILRMSFVTVLKRCGILKGGKRGEYYGQQRNHKGIVL